MTEFNHERDIGISRVEEIIAALWLIAALLALMAGIRWLAVVLFVKAGLDTACTLYCAVKEVASDMRRKNMEKKS